MIFSMRTSNALASPRDQPFIRNFELLRSHATGKENSHHTLLEHQTYLTFARVLQVSD